MSKVLIQPIGPQNFITTFEHAKCVEGFYENKNVDLRQWLNCGIRTGGYIVDWQAWLLPKLRS